MVRLAQNLSEMDLICLKEEESMPTSTIARMTTWVMIGCLAIGFARAAETGGSIAGVVRDNTGKPAVGA